MKSTTSFFNATLYRKTMKRFWPLWAAYSVVLAFMLPLHLLNNYLHYMDPTAPMDDLMWHRITEVPHLLPLMVPILLVGAVLCAMAVYGYLYNHKSSCMIHSLPMRRETIFFTQYLSGLSFMLLPLLAVTVLTAVIEVLIAPTGVLVIGLKCLLVWAVNTAAISLFFFSFATFCAMFTGHILALPVFYGVLNGLVAALYMLITNLMSLYFYGYTASFSPAWLKWLTPVWNLLTATGWVAEVTPEGQAVGGQLTHPSVPLIYAGVGLVLTVLALVVYRNRQLETAGDVVSVPLVRPLFRLGVAFCAGLAFGSFTAMFFGWQHQPVLLAAAVVIWSLVGYFAAEMLLEKTFRVFHKWKGSLILAAVMALLCASLQYDFLGVAAHVPAPEQVESLTVTMNMGYPNDSGRYVQTHLTAKDDAEALARMAELHQVIVDAHKNGAPDPVDSQDVCRVTLEYRLANGRTLHRVYNGLALSSSDLNDPSTVTGQLALLAGDRDFVAKHVYHLDLTKNGTLNMVSLEGCMEPSTFNVISDLPLSGLSGQQRNALWEAMLLDYEEGNIGFRTPVLTPEFMDSIYATHIVFYWSLPRKAAQQLNGEGAGSVEEWASDTEHFSYDMRVDLLLTPRAEHTLTLLRQYNALPEGVALTQLGYEVQEDGSLIETGTFPVELPVF